jgi:hypothetical protein
MKVASARVLGNSCLRYIDHRIERDVTGGWGFERLRLMALWVPGEFGSDKPTHLVWPLYVYDVCLGKSLY